MSRDIEALKRFYASRKPKVAEKLGEAHELSLEDPGPEHVLPISPAGIYTVPGFDRRPHVEEAEEVGNRIGNFESLRATLQELGLQYATSVGSGIKRLVQMPDTYSPSRTLVPINDDVSAYYRHRGLVGDTWEARIAYTTAQPYEEMHVRFTRENDDIQVKRVETRFHQRSSLGASAKSIYEWDTQGLAKVKFFSWGAGYQRSGHRVMEAVLNKRATDEFQRVFEKFFKAERADNYNIDLKFSESPSIRMSFWVLGVDTVASTFRYESQTGYFRRKLSSYLAESLLMFKVSPGEHMTQEEFAQLYTGMLALIPLEQVTNE